MFIATTPTRLIIKANSRNNLGDWAKVKEVAATLLTRHPDMSCHDVCEYDKTVILYTSSKKLTGEQLAENYRKALTQTKRWEWI